MKNKIKINKNIFNDYIKKIVASFMLIAMIMPQALAFAKVDDTTRFRTMGYVGGEENTKIVKTDSRYDKSSYYSYRIKSEDTNLIIRTGKIENTRNVLSSVYCLDLNQEFPARDSMEYISRGSWEKYNVGGLGLKRIEDNKAVKARLSRLFENLYLTKEPMPQRAENKKILANKAFGGDEKVFEVLTDSDIEVINQWAIWYFTNSDYFKSGFALNTLELELSKDNIAQNPVSMNLRKSYMMKLFNYYINSVNEENVLVEPKITAPKSAVLNSNGLNLKYFKIDFKENNKSNILNIDLIDEKGNVIPRENYLILDKLGNVLKGNIQDNLNKEIEIRINKNAENINEVNLGVKYLVSNTYNEVYRPNTQDIEILKKYQPVIELTKNTEIKNINAKIKITKEEKPEEKADLALRKSVIGVNGVKIDGRAPKGNEKIKTENLNNHLNLKAEDTTAKYMHPKNPVEVKPGDIVKYQISVFNEGSIDTKALEVKDILPKGLKFIETKENAKYKWEEQDGKVVTKLPAEILIPKMKLSDGKKSIFSLDLILELRVEENLEDKDILTNIAYISKMEKEDRDSKAEEINITEEDLKNYKGKSNKSDLSDPNYFYKGMEDDDDFEKLIVKKEKPEEPKEKAFDLSLKKYLLKIVKADGKEEVLEREPVVDVKPLAEGKTNAIYTKNEDKKIVKKGDTLIYKIRVYNEGEIDGFASKVSDRLPEGLKFLNDHEVNKKYGWILKTKDGKQEIETEYLKDKLIKAFDGKNLSYAELEVATIVDTNDGSKLLNIAEIVEHKDKDGKTPKDRDSVPGNKIPGEDDEDTEKVYVEKEEEEKKEADFALRKYITKVGYTNYEREPKVNVKPLLEGKNTAIYEHDKTPVKVKKGDLVTYKLAVYNEGDLDGYVKEVIDNIPEGLEFVKENDINKKYGWKMLDKDGNETLNIKNAVKVSSKYLSKEEDGKLGKNNLIKAFNKENNFVDFKELEIVFKVKDIKDENVNTKNIAEIAQIEDENGKKLEDRDSVPGNNKQGEDDIDTEEVNVEISKFDLKLVKFASNINGNNIENAEPIVNLKNLINGKSTTAEYIKSGNIATVTKGDIVKYTIRVYNEGNRNGYAAEVEDRIPEGLRFIPKHNVNTYYEWEMLDENGIVTEDAKKAKTIKSKFLNKEENMLKALDKENAAIDYRDIDVVFKVVADKNENNNLKNIAEITKNLDENKKEIKDIDSVPGNGNENEDDQDFENLKLLIFDLRLTKRISEITKTFENKNPETYYTKQTGEEKNKKPEIMQVNTWDNTKDVLVKYVIKVENEGNVEGTATEVKDYLPKGLIFVPNMNKDWKDNGDGTISSMKLANENIKPGEYREIEVILKWDFNWEDTGNKTNWAEIQKDTNKYNISDKDSVPGNFTKGEDDIDYAIVRIIPATGAKETYIVLITVILSIVFVGLLAVKKFVVDKKFIEE